MVKSANPVVNFDAITFSVSGTTHDLLMADFRIKPTGTRKRGFGSQYIYTLESREDYRDFVNHFDNKSNDWADAHGDDSPEYLAFVKDAERF